MYFVRLLQELVILAFLLGDQQRVAVVRLHRRLELGLKLTALGAPDRNGLSGETSRRTERQIDSRTAK